MGRRKYSAPRHGSLGFVRKRTSRIYPRVSTWPKVSETKILGFPVYKVGMTAAIERVEKRRSYLYGKSRSIAATVLEAPPIKLIAIRGYQDTPYGLRSVEEVWTNKLYEPMREPPRDLLNPEYPKPENENKRVFLHYLKRRITLPKEPDKKFDEKYLNEKRERFENLIKEGIIQEIRALIATRPDLTVIGKKTPEVMELGVGGDPESAFNFLFERLGGYFNIDEVFSVGEFVDAIGVTKGKGFQGVVKRFGVKTLPPKTKKEKRAVGSLGPWTPGGVMWTVPRYGQLGFFKRTEYNKQIIALFASEEKFTKFNPKGGWIHYGVIKNPAVVLRGSVQGPAKRIIMLRKAIRPKYEAFEPRIIEFYYSKEKIEV